MSASFLLPHVIFEVGMPAGVAAFGIDAAMVMQVIDVETLTPVPLAPPMVHGILNHNGRIVTVIDPAPLLGLEGASCGIEQVIILRREGRSKGHVGLLVLRIGEILAKSSLERVDVQAGPCVAWVARAKHRLIHIIDLEALFEKLGHQFGPPERGLPDQTALGVDL